MSYYYYTQNINTVLTQKTLFSTNTDLVNPCAESIYEKTQK